MISVNWYPATRQLRQFAVFSLLSFAVLGLTLWTHSGSPTVGLVCASVGGVMMVGGLLFPEGLRPFYALLMAVTLPIGLLVSQVFLRVLFYGLLTPIGLFFRLTGRDPLRLRRMQTDSYWRKHENPVDLGSYYRQA